MESFEGKLATVTGGGSGMGRELVLQLAAEGCSVAACDLNPDTVAEVAKIAMAGAPPGTLVTAHACDVSEEAQVLGFRDEMLAGHGRDHLDLAFNNAGIGGGASFVAEPREVWERTFAVDFFGVYYCTRAFLPLLIKSTEGILVNTSSVNGFWASLGPGIPNTAYSTAKFAVKGLTEGLIEDLRVHAPHVRVAVVMPGHIGTNIIENSLRAHIRAAGDGDPGLRGEALREELGRMGMPTGDMTAEQAQQVLRQISDGFRDAAPVDAAQAAAIILDGVRRGRWRILVGKDAEELDAGIRSDPDAAYDHQGIGLSLPSSRQDD